MPVNLCSYGLFKTAHASDRLSIANAFVEEVSYIYPPILAVPGMAHFLLLSHDLPIEQGRMARPVVPRYLRRCTLCSRHAPGDERHFMLECPQFDGIRAQYPDLLQDARDSMRNLMWHRNQKALSDFVIAILDQPRT